jgi:O-succinylbenzoate synthase
LTIEQVELRRIRLPLVSPFRTSASGIESRDVLLVRVITPEAEGWGECAAMNEPLYSPEYTEGAHAVMRQHLVPRLLQQPDLPATEVGRFLAPVKGHLMAKAALESAVLDAELRAAGLPLATYLGGTAEAVVVGVSVGLTRSVGELIRAVEDYLAEGYQRVKLKIEPGWDVGPVAAVRRQFPNLALQVDANEAYTLADSNHLANLDEFNLVLIEQPLPADDLPAHAELARRLRTPICLDESITSARAARQAIEAGATAIVNIKPGRVGGYLEARRVHDVCRESGVPVWCGGMLETGIGRAANLALAALPGFTLPGDISASRRYFARDVTPPFELLPGGQLAVPAGPGIGVEVNEEFLDEVTTEVERLRPG